MISVPLNPTKLFDRIHTDSTFPRPAVLAADGGAAANDVLMQIQADILGQPIERMVPLEATAFGAALLAGQAVGVWGPDAIDQLRKVDRTFEPARSSAQRDERFSTWRKACGL